MVIGDPVTHSRSPEIHNAGYAGLGIDDQFVYIASELTHLPEFLKGIRTMKHVRGLSCTMPYKQAVLPLLDQVNESAQKIGAVNTVVKDDERLTGYNTDWQGFLAAIQPHTQLKEKRVSLIGGGGAARSVLYALTSEGANVTIHNRNEDKAKQLAAEFNCGCTPLDDADRLQKADVIVNTTPIGMQPDTNSMPIPEAVLRAGQVVFDIVYTPYTTKLLHTAEARGATVIRGCEMLLQQAFIQFELFTGLEAPQDVMRQTLLAKLEQTT